MTSKHVLASFVLALVTAACSSDPDGSSDDSSKQGQIASATTTVTGRLFLDGDLSGIQFPVTATVTVRDVTYLDAAAVTVGSQTISITGPGPTEFSVPVSNISDKAEYAVDADVDANGDGQRSVGDYTTQESYSVLNEHGTERDITAKKY